MCKRLQPHGVVLLAVLALAITGARRTDAATSTPAEGGRHALRADGGGGASRLWARLAGAVRGAGALLAPTRRGNAAAAGLARTDGAGADGAGAGAGADEAGAGGSSNKKRGPTDFADGDDPSVRAHWAVLVAGSNGWGNYRHQADVYHAYQVLRRGGLRPERIITLAYDDIAGHDMNPVKGAVFNRPGGPDVYSGVEIDYRGPDVTADTLLAVLRGDRAKVAGRGSGRVLESGPHDKVFLFYSDHGAAGVLGMPEGPFLYADQLHSALRYRAKRDGFQEMVLYIEACESGSMFEGLLDSRLPIYATTAANAVESSWATYCPEFFEGAAPADNDPAALRLGRGGDSEGEWAGGAGLGHARAPTRRWRADGAAVAPVDPLPPPPPPSEWSTCLGDLYSVAWLEDAEARDMGAETLQQQYAMLRVRASNNFSYVQGSHVMRYGDLDIDEERAGDYLGMLNNGSAPAPAPSSSVAAAVTSRPRMGVASWLLGAFSAAPAPAAPGPRRPRRLPQRDADLAPLVHAARASPCPRRRAAAAAELSREVGRRGAADAAAEGAAALLLAAPGTGPGLLALVARAEAAAAGGGDSAAAAAAAARAAAGSGIGGSEGPDARPAAARRRLAGLLGGEAPAGRAVASLVSGIAGARPGGAPVVDDWGCLRGMVHAWEASCGRMDQYAMRHTRLMAGLCNAGVAPRRLGPALAESGACTGRGALLA